MDLTDGGQVLSAIFEARTRKKGKSRQNGRRKETNPPPKRLDFDSSAFYRHNQCQPNYTNPGVEETYLFHRKLSLAFGGNGSKHESLKE